MHELVTFLSQPLAMNMTAARSMVYAMVTGAATEREADSDRPLPYVIVDGANVPVQAMGDTGTGGGLTAVVPLSGALSMHGGWFSTSTKAFSGTLQALDASPRIANIVIPVDSPGGTVTGTMEAGNALRAIREAGNTRTIAVVEPMMASAATWIATAAERVVVTPSGEAGSIGVISMYQDWSKALEDMGVAMDIARTPDKKARFTGVEPMTDEMRETMEARNVEAYVEFVSAMAENRGVSTDKVKSDFGQGEMMSATEAVAAGLVDGVATLDAVLADLANAESESRSARRRRSEARLRLIEAT